MLETSGLGCAITITMISKELKQGKIKSIILINELEVRTVPPELGVFMQACIRELFDKKELSID